jgi:general stress protein 26
LHPFFRSTNGRTVLGELRIGPIDATEGGIMEWNDVVTRARAARGDGVFLSTSGGDGRPHVAWVGIGYGDETFWTATFTSSQKAKNLSANPAVALHWQEHREHLVFARASARLIDSEVERRALWDSAVMPYPLEMFWSSADDPELQFVELVPEKVTIWGSDHRADPEIWRPGRG